MGVVVFFVVALLLGEPVGAIGSDQVRLPVRVGSEHGALDDDADSYVVRRGDHLWKISARRLGDLLERPATNGETGPYWRSVIEVNRDRLRSGNPDLIYPGELVKLPQPG